MICDGLQAVALVQDVGHRQIDPAQLADVARKLDSRQGVTTELCKAPAGDTCHVPISQSQGHLQSLHMHEVSSSARHCFLPRHRVGALKDILSHF